MSFLSDTELSSLGFASMGENIKVSRKASIYGASRISLGSNVRIDDFCILSAGSGGLSIGSFVHIAAYASIIGRGRIEINDFAGISARVSVYSSSDDFTGCWMTGPTVPDEFTGVQHAPVTIGRHVIIGAGSVILPGASLEDGVAIGSLSLIKGFCREFGVYFGVPARRVAERKRNLLVLEEKFLASIEGKGVPS
ncbi:acyltransferase [Dechloromonas sp. H13]|uniref:acyltransferase n=1 Tax=Dechloromonas sp. H13 TaxID=2570193 RepID=UPI0012909315|nr:acyltransferase [Dechloromonas sp. H13]